MKHAILLWVVLASFLVAACAAPAPIVTTPLPADPAPLGTVTPAPDNPVPSTTTAGPFTLDPLLPSDVRAVAQKGIDRLDAGYGYSYLRLDSNRMVAESANQMRRLPM